MAGIQFYVNGSLVEALKDNDGMFDITTSKSGIGVSLYSLAAYNTKVAQDNSGVYFGDGGSLIYDGSYGRILLANVNRVVTKTDGYTHNIQMNLYSAGNSGSVLFGLTYAFESPESYSYVYSHLWDGLYALSKAGFTNYANACPATGAVYAPINGAYEKRNIVGVFCSGSCLWYNYLSDAFLYNGYLYLGYPEIHTDYIPYWDDAVTVDTVS